MQQSNKKTETQVTTLENGMKVATEKKSSPFCSVGVFIKSGSRYEINCPSGISNFLEALAFNSTTEYPSRDFILQELEKHSARCECMSYRDMLVYSIKGDPKFLPAIVNILSEVINRPTILPDELEATRKNIRVYLNELEHNIFPETILTEMIHSVAYNGNTLGLPHMCLKGNIGLILKRDIYKYMNNYHTPDRMVLVGVGVEHGTLVNLAREQFLGTKPIWKEQNCIDDEEKVIKKSVARYTGGEFLVKKDLSLFQHKPEQELVHVVFGLESCSFHDDDFIAFCVLTRILGGSMFFSTRGPGKNTFSILYANAIKSHYWIHNAKCVNHVYEDSGLFCIYASCRPPYLNDLAEVIVKELRNCGEDSDKERLNRAKIDFYSITVMNLEFQSNLLFEIGRDVLANDKRIQLDHYRTLIEKVTSEDIKRVVKRILKSQLSMAAYGSLYRLPSYKVIQKIIR